MVRQPLLADAISDTDRSKSIGRIHLMSGTSTWRLPTQKLLMAATTLGLAFCFFLYVSFISGTNGEDERRETIAHRQRQRQQQHQQQQQQQQRGKLEDQDFTKPALSMYILSNAPHAKINNFTEEDKFPGLSLYYQEATPPFNIRTKGQVLLLHGAQYSSATWSDEVGAPGPTTMQILAAAGYRVIAIDQPGFPQNTRGKLAQPPEEFLRDVIEVFELGKPVIVSPSASGRFSLPFISKYPQSVEAFVPIAPCCTSGHTELDSSSIPTLILQGELDVKPSRYLLSMPNSNVYIIPNAPHAAYLEQPNLFHTALINFLKFLHP